MKSKKSIISRPLTITLLASGFFCILILALNIDINSTSNTHQAERKKTQTIKEVESFETTALDENFNGMLQEVAKDYEDRMRFPSYSSPLNQKDWNKLNPRVFESVAMPLIGSEGLVPGLENIKATVEVDHYMVDVLSDLPIRVYLQSTQENDLDLSMVKIQLNPLGSQTDEYNSEEFILSHVYSETNSEIADNNGAAYSYFQGSISSEVLQTFGEGETRILAKLIFSNGIEATSGTSVLLYQSIAELDYLGSAYVDGPHLIVPVDMTVQIPGYYNLRANLFDESGVEPIAHLNERFKTDAGATSTAFKVHIATLKEKGITGPYLLKNISITRMPSDPVYKTLYGALDTNSYTLQGFEFDHYVDEEYVNQKIKKRMEFIRQLSERS